MYIHLYTYCVIPILIILHTLTRQVNILKQVYGEA